MTYQTGQRFKCLYKGEQSKGEITSIAGDFVELKINNKSTITVHKDALNCFAANRRRLFSKLSMCRFLLGAVRWRSEQLNILN